MLFADPDEEVGTRNGLLACYKLFFLTEQGL